MEEKSRGSISPRFDSLLLSSIRVGKIKAGSPGGAVHTSVPSVFGPSRLSVCVASLAIKGKGGGAVPYDSFGSASAKAHSIISE